MPDVFGDLAGALVILAVLGLVVVLGSRMVTELQRRVDRYL